MRGHDSIVHQLYMESYSTVECRSHRSDSDYKTVSVQAFVSFGLWRPHAARQNHNHHPQANDCETEKGGGIGCVRRAGGGDCWA